MFTRPKRTALSGPARRSVTIAACRAAPATSIGNRTAPRRRSGRPRLDARPVVGDPTEEILAAASRLFGQLGVEQTTMSRLAAEVGLKQSSLYYYFPQPRGDRRRARRQGQRRAAGAGRAASSPAAGRPRRSCTASCAATSRRCARCRSTSTRSTASRCATGALRRLLERAPPAGAPPGGVVRRGVDDGELRRVDPRLTALTIMANDEGVQNWYRLGTTRRRAAIGEALADAGRRRPAARPGRIDRTMSSAEVSTLLLKRSPAVLRWKRGRNRSLPTVRYEAAPRASPTVRSPP